MLHKKDKIHRAAVVILFMVYICCLLYFLFFSERYGRNDVADYYRYNIKPFHEIIRYLKYRKTIGVEMVVINLLGNIGVFMPFGFLLPIIWSPFKKWYAMLFTGICFSSIIECIQLITRVGTMDVDDVILNVTGIMLGLALLKICSMVRKKSKD